MAESVMWDARDVSIIVDGMIVPELMGYTFDDGETSEPAVSAQGFVGHQIKHGAAKLTIKVTAPPHSAFMRRISDLRKSKQAFTCTISTPGDKGTMTQCMISKKPTSSDTIEDMPVYEIEINGKAADVRYE